MLLKPSSLSGKVFVAFLVVLATFGGVSAYGALTMLRLGDEVRRVAGGYSTLRLEVQDLRARQANLVEGLERADEDAQRAQGLVKAAVDVARSYRKAEVRRVRGLANDLMADSRSAEETAFLNSIVERLRAVEALFVEDEALFDRVFGPPGAKPVVLAALDRRVDATARERLRAREAQILHKDLADLAQALLGRVQRAQQQLERDARRAVWATVGLALLAAAVAALVIALVGRALKPLTRLAASAKQVARGDYRQRVEVPGADEIGALAGEFNAMAAALEERESRLIRSERLAAVGKIAAQITHEVRNPLSSIGLNAELLEDELGGLDDGGEAQKIARAIVKEVDRLAEITEQYLKFARLPRPKLEREEPNAIITSLLAFVREEFAARGIAVEARLGARLPAVNADENQLRQALLNLLRNAAEATQSGGRVTVETRAKDGFVETVISDTGEGIRAEDRARIFDPFFSTKQGGTGLGLSLTQQIIVEHGGSIDLDSTPGRGTSFTVRLPAIDGAEPSTSPTISAA